MEIDEHFDPTDDDPAVPDKLLDRTMKYLPSLMRVDVERKRGTNSWKKINGFKVTRSQNGEPTDPPEDVATMIVMISLSHVEETGDDGHYRAKFHVAEKGGKIQRKTFAFKLSAESGEAEPTLDDLERQEVLAVAFDRSIALIEVQNRHIEAQNARILEQAQTQAGQTAPLLQTIETLVNKYHEGLMMQANALQALYDNERAVKAEEAKAERDKALIDILAVAAPKAMEQFGGYLQKKSDQKALPAADPNGSGKDKKDESAASKDESAPQETKEITAVTQKEPAQGEQVVQLEKPLTVFAHAFRDSIESPQWMELSEALSKTQMKYLRAATTAEEDDETAEGIIAFKDSLKPTQYLRLQRILDQRQQNMIARLIELIAAYEEPADGDDEEPADDPEDEEE